jgi:hypothetical protein
LKSGFNASSILADSSSLSRKIESLNILATSPFSIWSKTLESEIMDDYCR